MAFIDTIYERARADKQTIVLPESMDKRTYEAAEKILKLGIANLVIIGTPEEIAKNSEGMIHVSAATGEGIDELKNRIAALKPEGNEGRIIADRISAGDLIVLVVPIDKAAPKGRLILPQQQTIRDILDAGATALAVRDSELEDTLKSL